MSWQHWVLLVVFVLRILTIGTYIDKPRETMTLQSAVTGVFVGIIFIMLLLWGQQ